MLKKQLYMEHVQSEIGPEYNGSLSCDRHLKWLFGVVCGLFMNIRGDEPVYHVNCPSSGSHVQFLPILEHFISKCYCLLYCGVS
jgi:hypothetical protein